jgi:DNA segregation ATPase FtsK/SpoIIIE-like protein
MNFLTPLDVRYIDGKRWLLMASFGYRLGAPDGEEFVLSRAGSITNFASIPRPLKLIWPSPGGPWDKPAVIHDELYVRPYVFRHVDGKLAWRRVERVEADDIFAQAMKVTKTNGASLRLLHRGVRIGGKGAWDRYRQAEAEQLETAQAAHWWMGDPWHDPIIGLPADMGQLGAFTPLHAI